MYYRANITTIEERRSPVLPDGLQFVPEELCRLLQSGRDYPPALDRGGNSRTVIVTGKVVT